MSLNLTNHKAIDTYYNALANYQTQGVAIAVERRGLEPQILCLQIMSSPLHADM